MLNKLRLRLRALFFKSKMEDELQAELQFHIEREIEENIVRGMTPEEARCAAIRSFGGVERVKEESRDARGVRLLEEVWQDLRYSARMLLKRPGFTLIAVITLALGIGANTAIFSVVNAVLLRPLNYKDSDRLVQLNHHYKKTNGASGVSVIGYTHYRDNSKSFESITACAPWSVNLTGIDVPERLNGYAVTHTFFQTLGVEAAKGRVFTPDEDRPGHNRVVTLSDSLWQRRFAADPDIVGKTITLSGEPYTVVGVLPPDFQLGREWGQAIDIYSPIAITPQMLAGAWLYETLSTIAKLKQNVTLPQAQAEMDTIAANVPADVDKSVWGLLLRPLREIVVRDIRRPLIILMAAVGFVLLIACANVANLLLARATVRQKEMAIRIALGAGRWRVIRQLLTESALIALIGGALGLLLANVGMQSLLSLNEKLIPRAYEVGIDWRVLASTFGLSLLTGLLFGLAPALHSSKTDLHNTLKEGGRSGVALTRGWLRSGLMVFEVTSTLVLLIGAGLLIKSFWLVQEVNPGFNPNNLLTLELSLPDTKYKEPAQIDGFFQRTLAEISALPGVKSAGLSSTMPMSNSNQSGCVFVIEGRAPTPGDLGPWGDLWFAGENYFQTMNIPLIRGRYFDNHDTLETPSVAIIDETMARKWWPNEDPIGKRIWVYENDPQGNKRWREIVGIVGHVRRNSLDRESPVQYYLPHRQRPTQGVILAVRTTAEPESMTAAVRSIIRSADKELPVYKVATMERMMSASTAQRRFSTILLSVFALVALILASVGLFGVVSYTVSQRTHEIGIRMALGAQTLDVVKLITRQGMTLVLTGMAFGLMAAFGLMRMMKTLLFGVSETDTATFVIIPLLLAGVAMLACYLPARRATKVDPLIALRSE
jgi:putative ABC transport system permease protein